MAAFLTATPTPALAASFLGASTLLSFIKGYTTTAAIGGADMRKLIDLFYSFLLPFMCFNPY